jgi:hypothetical protein
MAIKSAYELAMERLGKQPTQKLTAKQKADLAELDKVYAAKIAERELELKPKIAAARGQGDFEAAEKLEETLRAEIVKLRAKLEEEKEKVRQSSRS